MSSGVRLDGFEEFRAALQHLPDELVTEAAAIVINAGSEAQQQIEDGYPQGPTGNLKRGVKLTRESSRLSARAVVRSTARHASIYEHGSKPRHTGRGWNRGRMPEPPAAAQMLPKVIRIRKKMQAALIDMVRAAGLLVHE